MRPSSRDYSVNTVHLEKQSNAKTQWVFRAVAEIYAFMCKSKRASPVKAAAERMWAIPGPSIQGIVYPEPRRAS